MNTEQLLPCPFCGSYAHFKRLGTSRQSCIVACGECGVRLHKCSEMSRYAGTVEHPLFTAESMEARISNIRQALRDLVTDLEQRSTLKEGADQGVVDCGQGVYMRAKQALGDL